MKMENYIRAVFVGFGCYLSVQVISIIGSSLANYNEPLLMLTLFTNTVGYLFVFNKIFDGVLWLLRQSRNSNQGL